MAERATNSAPTNGSTDLAELPGPGSEVPAVIDRVGVVGCGLMGSGIAEVCARAGLSVIVVEAGLRSLDRRYEEAAATLGAHRFTTFRRVVLPLIAPSLVAGAALTWARALGEFRATILFAGNLQGKTQTMPLAIFVELQTNLGGAIALSLVLLAVSIVVLVSLRDRWFPA